MINAERAVFTGCNHTTVPDKKHAEVAVRSEPVKAWSVDDELSADAPDKEPTPKEDSESVQETSSEKSDA